MQPAKTVWAPNPGSQPLFLTCPIREALLEGTRGGGKTDVLGMDFGQHCGPDQRSLKDKAAGIPQRAGFGDAWRGVLFRRTYKQLDDVVSKTKRWFYQIWPGIRLVDYTWKWRTGEELLLRHFDSPDDYWNYHGHEYPWIAWEELTGWSTLEGYEAMLSCNRSSYPGIPLKVRANTNPYGVGHNAVKKYWIDPMPRGTVLAEERIIPQLDAETGELVRRKVLMKRVALHSSYIENPKLLLADPMYLANIESISDPNKRKAWLFGSWDINSGGALDGVWGKHLILPRFKVPKSWRIDRSFDWGMTAPFSVLWFAEADGTEATFEDGTKFCPPRGTLVVIHEWYGADTDGKGLSMTGGNIAIGILEREAAAIKNGWFHSAPRPGPADNAISNVLQPGTPTIAKEMADEKIYWTISDKAPGTRIIGLALIRSRLEQSAKKPPERPALFFMDHCRKIIAHLPDLPRDEKDPDKADSESEDHDYDALRYRVLASKPAVTSINIGMAC